VHNGKDDSVVSRQECIW